MSSFSYLKNLPVDFLKIDGSFIRGLSMDEMDQVMVHSIHDIAKVAGIQTIAECVENEGVLTLLRRMGVDYVQGFHLGPPGLVTHAAVVDRASTA
jgi:Amt family ammonium transporter